MNRGGSGGSRHYPETGESNAEDDACTSTYHDGVWVDLRAVVVLVGGLGCVLWCGVVWGVPQWLQKDLVERSRK